MDKSDIQTSLLNHFRSSEGNFNIQEPNLTFQKASLPPSERAFLLPKETRSTLSIDEENETILTNSPMGLQKRKEELNQRFNQKHYKSYYLWLHALIILSTFLLISTAICAITERNFVGFYMSCLCSFWMILQCLIEIKAIKTRNPDKARIVVKLMIMFLPIILFTIILLLLTPRVNEADKAEANSPRRYILVWVYSFGGLLVVHLLVNLCMAVKVKNILTRIETLEHVLQQKLMYHGV